MRKTRYTVKLKTQFKRDYKLAIKRGLNTELMMR
jgi:mRNA-degrading endonuclease YafQ of YafQ-DinJ toxin-antitoxin module